MNHRLEELSKLIKKIATSDFSWLIDFVKKYAWAMEFVIVIFITMVLSYFEHVIYQRIHPRLLKSKKMWQHATLHAMHKPLVCLIWLLGLTFALDLVGSYVKESHILSFVPPLRKVGVIVLLLWFMIDFIKEVEKIFLMPKAGKYPLDRTTVRAIGQVIRILVIGTSVFVILQITLGIGASGILAFAGGGGIIIGWAAKDMLANVFGGFMIFLDRPFAIGDRITSLDKQIDGYVEHIGWRLTCVRNLDKVPVYIPNSFFSSMSIENPSRMTHRRIYATISLRYDAMSKMGEILKDIGTMLKEHQGLDQLEPNYAKLVNCNASSLDVLVYGFTKTTDLEEFYGVREEVFLKILTILQSHGTSCAYPVTEGAFTVKLEK